MLTGQCHCGNIKMSVPELPESLTSCNCSICSRYASLWGYYLKQNVAITEGKLGLKTYSWGDGYINFHHCNNCGCVTHYTSTSKSPSDKVAVNFRMFDTSEIENISIRRFDGADTWKVLE